MTLPTLPILLLLYFTGCFMAFISHCGLFDYLGKRDWPWILTRKMVICDMLNGLLISLLFSWVAFFCIHTHAILNAVPLKKRFKFGIDMPKG